MKQVTEYISLPTRSNRSFYFFVGFVYPLLPLDLTSNKSDSWNRIYTCFNQILRLYCFLVLLLVYDFILIHRNEC